MKKTLIFLIVLFLFLVGIKTTNTYASNTTYSDNLNGKWTPDKTIKTEIMGMEHLSVYGVANSTNPQHINVLSMKTDGYSSKLVTWSKTDGNKKYTRQTLDEIAKDYEANHPGWIVIGGINADQYTTGFGSDIGAGSAYFTPQTYYPLIMDNESRIPYTVLNSYNMHVGFANDGSSDSLIGASPIVGYELKVIDQYKNVIASFDVNKINESPQDGETTAWSTYSSIRNLGEYNSRKVESDVDIYVVENPELAYMSNCREYGGVDSFFGRGIISKIDKSHNLIFNQFAIETKNKALQEALDKDVRIVVDAKYESEKLNSVEASTGYHSVHRYNDVDQPLVHTSYDGNRYSRAIIGKKADGTYVLLTVDVATDPNDLTVRYAGMGFDECNATLKHYGVVEAYQMDGGGSVTSILRNEEGGFDITNFPRDGVRANMTGLLYVVRSPELSLTNSDYHSITFTHNPIINGINSKVENIKVYNKEKEYTVNDSKVVVDGLEENKEYTFTCTYDVVSNDGKTQSYTTTLSGKTTLYEEQNANFFVTNISKNSFTINKEHNENIKNVKIETNGTMYQMNEDKVIVDELIGGTTYSVEIAYDIYDPLTTNIYSRKITLTDVTTSLFEVPSVVKFEIYRQTTSRITLSYEYSDTDKIVSKAYIKKGEEIKDLTGARGTASFSDLDFENNEYIFVLVIVYKNDTEDIYIESEEIKVGTKHEEPVEVKHSITYNLDGGTLVDAPNEYTEGIGIEVLPTPTKEGYNFLGWYIGSNKVESISTDAKEDITLVAKWEEIVVPKEHEHVACPTCGLCTSSDCDGDTSVKCPGHTETPKEEKKGCGCSKSASYFMVFSAILGVALILFRKRK